MPPIAVLVALADPTRCRIVEILREGPQPVHVVAGAFKISRPAISRHLRVLKQAKLISEKKTGRENRYALHAEKLKPVAEWLAEMRESASAVSKVPKRLTKKPAQPALAASAPAPVPPRPQPGPELVSFSGKPVTIAPKAASKPVTTRTKPETAPSPEVSTSQMGFDF